MQKKGKKQEKWITERPKHKVGKKSMQVVIIEVNEDTYRFECQCGARFNKSIAISHDCLPCYCRACAKRQATASGSAVNHASMRADLQRQNTKDEQSMIDKFIKEKGA